MIIPVCNPLTFAFFNFRWWRLRKWWTSGRSDHKSSSLVSSESAWRSRDNCRRFTPDLSKAHGGLSSCSKRARPTSKQNQPSQSDSMQFWLRQLCVNYRKLAGLFEHIPLRGFNCYKNYYHKRYQIKEKWPDVSCSVRIVVGLINSKVCIS